MSKFTQRRWFVIPVMIVMAWMFCANIVLPVEAKETVVIGMQEYVSSLDPAKSFEMMGYGLLHQCYERLVTFNPDDLSQPLPGLAESWEVNADGKTWTFHLRPNVRFASGNPLTADDVLFSLRRVEQIGAGPSYIVTQLGITTAAVTKLDDLTVQIALNQPYAPSLALACLAAPVASIVDGKLLQEHEQNGDFGSAWLEEHSAGTGRFVLTEQQRGDHYLLTANEQYWGNKSAFRQMLVRVVSEPSEQAALLEQGTIDVAWNLQPAQADQLAVNKDIEISQTLTFYIRHVGMNVGYEPLAKPEVRNAIRYAIDYNRITKDILAGAAQTNQTFLPRGLMGYRPDLPFIHDPEQAKALLQQAGYPDGFEVELKCLNYSPWVDMAMQIQKDLGNIGIKVNIVQLDLGKLWEDLSTQRAQLLLWEWVFDYFDPDSNAKLLAYGDRITDDAPVKTMFWWLKYANAETTKLADQAALEQDTKTREALYQQISDILTADGPHLFLCSPIQLYAIRKEVAEFIGTPSVTLFDFPTIK